MRRFLYLTAVTLSIGLPAGAFAQGGGGGGGSSFGGGGGGSSFGGGGGGGSSFGGGGSSFGGGGSSFGGGGGSSFSGSGSGMGFGGGSSFSGGTGGTSFSGGGGGTSYGGGSGGRGVAGGSGGVSISPTNAFATYYANPMYYGRPGSSSTSMGQASNVLKGNGFGMPSSGSVTTAGATTGVGGRAGAAGGLAGRTGTAGIAGRGVGGGYGGIGGGYGGMNSTPQVSYTATVAYSGPATITPVARADLQGLLNRSSALSRPGTIRVEAVGEVIVLRGKVANDDERRLVEGMVRLEPGVHDVRNDLEVGP